MNQYNKHFVESLRDLANRIESGEANPREMIFNSPVAQFAPPGAVTYDNVHTGEVVMTLELAWEDVAKAKEFWKRVNKYGQLPARYAR